MFFFLTFSCPVPEAPHHNDSVHFHLLAVLFTTVLLFHLLRFSFLLLVTVSPYLGILQTFVQPSNFVTTYWNEIFKVVKSSNFPSR